MPSARRKCVLIDGNSLLYRAFYAIRFLSTRDGRPTNALYGFATMLLKLMADEEPDAMIVAFDAPAKTFRHEEFADYKATRKPTPDELKQQSPVARDLARSLGLPVLEVPGFEADDIVGTCAVRAADAGYDVLIVTGDLDELQLVTDDIHVAVTGKGVSDLIVYTPETVRKRFGLSPEQFVDYKALKGDTSDNIPGVPGVGDKTASRLIADYGGIDELLSRLEELPDGKLKDSLRASQGQIPLSRRLATIVCDVPLDIDPGALPPFERPADQAERLFAELEFETLARRLPRAAEPESAVVTPARQPRETSAVSSLQEFDEKIRLAREAGRVSYRLALDRDGLIRSVGLAVGGESFQVAVRGGAGVQQDLGSELEGGFTISLEALRPVFEDAAIRKAGYDIKGCAKAFARAGVNLQGDHDDVMLAGFLLQPGRGDYSLQWLAQQFLGNDLAGGLRAETGEAYLAGVIEDLLPVLEGRLASDGLTDVYHDIEMPLAPVLCSMEMRGVRLDRGYLSELAEGMARDAAQLEKRIQELAGEQFNIGSTKQLAAVLFEKLQLPPGRKTKTGFSTDADTLEGLAAEHEIAARILEWRELTKLKGTYADALPKLVDPDTGRLHTTLNQTGAATGRLSSSDPNLQNIPIKSEAGRRIRAAFVAAPRCSLLSADYSQIELRLLAHMSGDEELIRCFREGEDIHTRTASALFGVGVGEVDSEMRRRGKTINFSVLYGKTDYGLARELGITQKEARDYIDAYFQQYPRVKEFNTAVLDAARRDGWVRTLFGRKRWIPELKARDHNVRANAERAAFNAPLQGTAADIIKLAMISLEKQLVGLPGSMLLQVHDELVLDVERGHEAQVASVVKREMEGVADLSVPLTVDVRAGENWRDMSPLEL